MTLDELYAQYRGIPSSLNVPQMQAYGGSDLGGVDPSLANSYQQPQFSWQSRLGGAARSFLGDRDLALALLANSGYSPQKQGFGQILGQSMLQADAAKRARQQQDLDNQFALARLQGMQRQNSPYGAIQPDKFTPESLAQFEKTGKYSDLKLRPIGMQTGRYNPGDFTPESWAAFLQSNDPAQLVRYVTPQNATVESLGGGKSIVQPSKIGGAPMITPLTTPQQEFDAAAKLKGAEAEASAVGAGKGAVVADIRKKGSQAQNVENLLDIAEPLVQVSTGSTVGAAADKVAAFFGKSLDGATAISQLKAIEGQLIAQMPRMEGPQSDADRLLYQKAAGDIANPFTPREQRLASMQTIRRIQQTYKDRAANTTDTGKTKELTYDPATGTFK